MGSEQQPEVPEVSVGNEPQAGNNDNDSVFEPIEEEPTFNLMGVEMTLEEAIEHCQVMPEMPECSDFPSPPPIDSAETAEEINEETNEVEEIGSESEETDGEVS